MALDKLTYQTSVENAFKAAWPKSGLLKLQADIQSIFTTALAASSTTPAPTDEQIRTLCAESIAAAIHKYVQGGGDRWTPCRAAYTTAGNLTFAGSAPLTVDGVTPLYVNDRILVTGQTLAYNNGIYVVTTPGTGANGTWTRATDLDTGAEVSFGDFAWVMSGTLNADSFWKVTSVPTAFWSAGSLTFEKQATPPGIEALAIALTDANEVFVKSATLTFKTHMSGLQTTTALGTATAAPLIDKPITGMIS